MLGPSFVFGPEGPAGYWDRVFALSWVAGLLGAVPVGIDSFPNFATFFSNFADAIVGVTPIYAFTRIQSIQFSEKFGRFISSPAHLLFTFVPRSDTFSS